MCTWYQTKNSFIYHQQAFEKRFYYFNFVGKILNIQRLNNLYSKLQSDNQGLRTRSLRFGLTLMFFYSSLTVCVLIDIFKIPQIQGFYGL